MTRKTDKMMITKETMEKYIKHAFYSGMNCGYGVNHENLHEDEDILWNEFWNYFKSDNTAIKQ